ncbi:MAG TPA: glutathione S-transferase family protein [Bauldia sp.]|nr:glutathione S-transferase family protein [Bauldia sp.]
MSATTGEYILYSMQSSGNCYKPRLMLHLLGLPFRLVDVAPDRGETRTAEFLALNPNGRVPLLVLPDGRKLSESNAMLLYLADGTRYLPADRYERAQVNQWLFFEQYDHEPQIAVARSWITVYPDKRGKATREQLAGWLEKGNRALAVMEARLKDHDWLVGYNYSVADIALYAYTHVAEEGGYELAQYPGISRWIARVAAAPRHVSLDWRP